MTSAVGNGAAKTRMQDVACEIFADSAHRGNVQGMAWLSWMEDDGLAGPKNPETAAHRVRKAMEPGSETGAFNYGLDVLRGRGVPYDRLWAGRSSARPSEWAARRRSTSLNMTMIWMRSHRMMTREKTKRNLIRIGPTRHRPKYFPEPTVKSTTQEKP